MIGATLPAKRKAPSRKNRRKKAPGTGFGGPGSPALKRVSIGFGVLTLLGVLMVGLFFGYRWVTTTENLALSKIIVTGTDHLSYGDVLAAARVSLGNNSLDLNVSAIQARLAKNPWVADVSVRRELPGKLIIDIDERLARFWTVSGDRLYYCDGTGQLITAVTPGDFQSLPVLEAPAHMRGHLSELPAVLASLQAGSLAFNQDRIASVRILESGQMECLLDKSRLTLQFSMDNHQAQLGRLQRVVDDLRKRGELAQAAVITAGPDRIWVEKRTKTPGLSG